MNINEWVWVKLTPDGWILHDKHWEDHLGEYFRIFEREFPRSKGRDQWQKFQLWDLMSIFGPGIHMTGPVFFEGNEIYFEDPES